MVGLGRRLQLGRQLVGSGLQSGSLFRELLCLFQAISLILQPRLPLRLLGSMPLLRGTGCLLCRRCGGLQRRLRLGQPRLEALGASRLLIQSVLQVASDVTKLSALVTQLAAQQAALPVQRSLRGCQPATAGGGSKRAVSWRAQQAIACLPFLPFRIDTVA